MTSNPEIARLDAERALAMQLFPAEWAQAEKEPGERRRRRFANLRRRALNLVKITGLREAGASCGNCNSFSKAPAGLHGRVCDAHSDFHGYVTATHDGLCVDWSARSTQRPENSNV